jgi:hypothetical protein
LDSQGSVGEGKTGKATPDAGRKSVSEKSQVTGVHQQEPFEKSSSHHTEYFVRLVKDKRTGKNGAEFLIVWRDFPFDKHGTVGTYNYFDGIGQYDLLQKQY